MKYKILIFVIVLGVSSYLTYYFTNNKTISVEDREQINKMISEQQNIVIYTNEGFEPRELEIKKGETIKFINMSDRKMWVASNDHPSHNIYPEFDQKDIVVRNGEYEFIFERTGIWEYHNHLFSSHEATITVLEN